MSERAALRRMARALIDFHNTTATGTHEFFDIAERDGTDEWDEVSEMLGDQWAVLHRFEYGWLEQYARTRCRIYAVKEKA